MGTYLVPASVAVSSSWQDHRDRTPPSAEPGTDYATAYGTDLAAAASGFVSVIDTSPGGGEGRRLSIDLDDGRRVSYIHLSRVAASIGQRITRGQRGFIWSGASGYGSDWYYGPHVHVSLWERPGMAYADTIDFQRYVGEPDVPPPPPPDPEESEDDEMMKGASYKRTDGVTVFLLFNESSGWWCEHSGTNGDYNNGIARNWETNSWPTITQAHRNVIVSALDNVRQGK